MILDLVSVWGKMHQAYPKLMENCRDPRTFGVHTLYSLLYSYKASENTVLWDARLSWSNGAHDQTMNEPGIPFQERVYTS